MQISSLIGTIILSPEGERLGYVKDVLLTRDLKAVASLVAVDGDEEEFYLAARTVHAVKDAMIAGKARLTAPVGVPSPLGRAVYSQSGEYLGAVSDVTLAEDSIVRVIKDGEEQSFAGSHVAVGETVIVYEGRRPAQKRPAPQKPKILSEPDVTDADETENDTAPEVVAPEVAAPEIDAPESTDNDTPGVAAETPHPTTPQQKNKTVQTGNAFGLNRYNLIGRRVKKSVFDDSGTPVALAGERITPEILSAARKRNRLLQLAVNTLTTVY